MGRERKTVCKGGKEKLAGRSSKGEVIQEHLRIKYDSFNQSHVQNGHSHLFTCTNYLKIFHRFQAYKK